MHFDCERAMKLTIPAMRIAVSSVLERKYGMTQSSIAAKLGVAQAAVSKYDNHKYSDKLDDVVKEIRKLGLDANAAKFAAGGADGEAVAHKIDELASDSALISAALRLCRGADA